jgi:HNH endonuclease
MPLRDPVARRDYNRNYSRLYKHGLIPPLRRTPTEPRFWAKVDKEGPVQPHCPELGNCWTWTGAAYRYGYGYIWVAEIGKQRSAARYSWELVNGPSDPALDILHHCDNPRCVRPSHLFQGTHSDNMRDCYRKRRHPKARGYVPPQAPKTERL